MTAIKERSRSRTIAMVASTVAVLLIAPVLLYVGVSAISNSTGGKDALADNLTIQEFPPTPTAALITADSAGELTSVTVFALHPSGVGGSAISVPITGDTSFDPENRRSLQQVYAEGGVDGMQLALESLLVLTVGLVADADQQQITELLQPYAPITVELPNPVSLGGPDTSADTVPDDTATDDTATDDTATGDTATEDTATAETVETIPAGPSELTAEQAAAIMTTGAVGVPESARRPTLDALWAGIAAAIGEGSGTAAVPGGTLPTTLDDYFARLVSGPVQARGLNATPIETSADGYEIEEVARAEVLLVFGSIAPGAVSSPSPGLSFRLEAPPGYEAEVERTIAKLVFLGGNVVSVDLTRRAQTDTIFIVADEVDRAEAGTTNMIFGDFTFQDPKVRIDGVDMTVILGTDYLATVDVQPEAE